MSIRVIYQCDACERTAEAGAGRRSAPKGWKTLERPHVHSGIVGLRWRRHTRTIVACPSPVCRKQLGSRVKPVGPTWAKLRGTFVG